MRNSWRKSQSSPRLVELVWELLYVPTGMLQCKKKWSSVLIRWASCKKAYVCLVIIRSVCAGSAWPVHWGMYWRCGSRCSYKLRSSTLLASELDSSHVPVLPDFHLAHCLGWICVQVATCIPNVRKDGLQGINALGAEQCIISKTHPKRDLRPFFWCWVGHCVKVLWGVAGPARFWQGQDFLALSEQLAQLNSIIEI